jgi:hypothetical protein
MKLQGFYEKIGEVDYLSGLVTKYREVTAFLYPDNCTRRDRLGQQTRAESTAGHAQPPEGPDT